MLLPEACSPVGSTGADARAKPHWPRLSLCGTGAQCFEAKSRCHCRITRCGNTEFLPCAAGSAWHLQPIARTVKRVAREGLTEAFPPTG